MNNKFDMNISISGTLGSGKSTISKLLLEEYNFDIVSAGTIMRKLAIERNMEINEFIDFIADKPQFDMLIDREISKIGLHSCNTIFDSRIAWFLVMNSFKIFLYANDDVSAKRIFQDKKRINESFESVSDAKEKFKERFKKTIQRLNSLYQIDILNR